MCLQNYYTNCIEFSAALKARLSALGYTAESFDDLIVEIIAKGGSNLSEQVSALKTTVENISADTIKVNAKMFGLTQGSVDAANVTYRNFEYAYVGGDLTFNLSGLKDNLPQGVSYLKARVDVLDPQGEKISRQGLEGVIPGVKAGSTVTFSLDGLTKYGTITLDKNVYLESDVEKTGVMNIRDFSNAPADLTLREFAEVVAANVAIVKQK